MFQLLLQAVRPSVLRIGFATAVGVLSFLQNYYISNSGITVSAQFGVGSLFFVYGFLSMAILLYWRIVKKENVSLFLSALLGFMFALVGVLAMVVVGRVL